MTEPASAAELDNFLREFLPEVEYLTDGFDVRPGTEETDKAVLDKLARLLHESRKLVPRI